MTVPQRAGADLRWLRAAAFSAVCVALSATAHVIASGAGLPLWSLVLGWAIVLCGVVPLAARERKLPGIALVLLIGELGLHLVFCFAQGGMAATTASTPNAVVALVERMVCGPEALHLTPQSAALIMRKAGLDPASAATLLREMHGAGASGASVMSQMAASSAGTSAHAMSLAAMFTPTMLAAHLVAALVAGWLLRRGEVALWQIVRFEALVVERVAVLSRLAALVIAAFIVALVADLLERCLSAARRHVRTLNGGRRLESVLLAHSLLRRGPPAAVLTA